MSTTDSPRSAGWWRSAGRGLRRFRRWRRGRPFWGGLFLVLGGVQLFLSSQLSLLEIEISFGPEGFLAILLPAVLLLCGALLWITPQHRYFYSIVGTLTAVYSLLGLNLGGWFLGMLLGIVGGALGFAWTPESAPRDGRPAEDPGPDRPAEDPGPDQPAEDPGPDQPAGGGDPVTGPLADQPPGPDQTAPVRAPRRQPRTYAVLSVPLLLAAPPVLLGTASADHCLLPVLCWHAPAASPTPDPGPEPSGSPTPTVPPGGSPQPTPTGAPAPPPTGQPAAPPTSATPRPAPSPVPAPVPALEPPPGQPVVASNPARMTADRLTQENFRFDGITELPTATGPVRVLRFSFSRATATDFTLAATRDGDTILVTADPLVISGEVAFYTSRFSGRLFGVLPLELAPDSPLVDLLELVDLPLPVLFTDVDLDLVFTTGAELVATSFGLALASG